MLRSAVGVKQRHSVRQLFWRGVVAAVGNTAMATGVYPLVPHLGRMAARARARRPMPPRQVRAMAGEWAVAAALSAARPLGFLGLPGTTNAKGPRPIVFVHGYGMNRANFLPLAFRLSRAGLGPLHGFEYWSLGKVSSAARRLRDFVEEICLRTGAPSVDIIGHSMGGVVGRYLVSLGGGSARVADLVTVGSPHMGADLSGFGIGRPTRELLPGSAFLERLDAARIPSNVRLTSIWSRSDALVPGRRSARLNAANVEEIVFDDLGHLSLLTSRRVTRVIIRRCAI